MRTASTSRRSNSRSTIACSMVRRSVALRRRRRGRATCARLLCRGFGGVSSGLDIEITRGVDDDVRDAGERREAWLLLLHEWLRGPARRSQRAAADRWLSTALSPHAKTAAIKNPSRPSWEGGTTEQMPGMKSMPTSCPELMADGIDREPCMKELLSADNPVLSRRDLHGDLRAGRDLWCYGAAFFCHLRSVAPQVLREAGVCASATR